MIKALQDMSLGRLLSVPGKVLRDFCNGSAGCSKGTAINILAKRNHKLHREKWADFGVEKEQVPDVADIETQMWYCIKAFNKTLFCRVVFRSQHGTFINSNLWLLSPCACCPFRFYSFCFFQMHSIFIPLM